MKPNKRSNQADGRIDAGPPLERAFSIFEFCRRYGIGRTHAYDEIKAERLRAVKAGRRTLITLESAEAWLAALPKLETATVRQTEERC